MQKEYTQTKEQVLEGLRTDRQGLSAQEAEKRLREHGENRLKEAEKLTLFQRFVQQLKDPMLLILLAAAAVSAVTNILSHESFTEVIIILLVVLLNAILGVVQESKAEAAIEALQTMTAATCKVLRDGQQVTMESRLLVPGDVVLLEAGDAVPADGRILESASMKIEEAALTGESVPVSKFTEPLAGEQVSLGDRKNMAYMGSTQFKAFEKCEAAALAELKGEYHPPSSTALLVGGYIDAWFSGELPLYQAQHPEIFKRDGTLKAEYLRATEVVVRMQSDELYMLLMSGRKQVIRTGEIAGVPFKIKIDSLLDGDTCKAIVQRFPNTAAALGFCDGAIVDQKAMKDMADVWSAEDHCKIPFIEFYGYDIQGAIYQAIEGNMLPFILAVGTKEETPDLEASTSQTRTWLPSWLKWRTGHRDTRQSRKVAFNRPAASIATTVKPPST